MSAWSTGPVKKLDIVDVKSEAKRAITNNDARGLWAPMCSWEYIERSGEGSSYCLWYATLKNKPDIVKYILDYHRPAKDKIYVGWIGPRYIRGTSIQIARKLERYEIISLLRLYN